MPDLFLRPGFFFVHFLEITMIPFNTKAVLELAVTLIATITSEVLASRQAAKRDTRRNVEGRHDRPS
jgi:hypothetical protein